jgi:hypothetical protein
MSWLLRSSGMILSCWFNELPVFQRTTVLSSSRAKEPKKKILIMHFSPFSPCSSLWCQYILCSRLLSHTLNLYKTWRPRSGEYEKYCLLECDAIKCRRSVLVFERIWLPLHQVRCPDKETAGPLEMSVHSWWSQGVIKILSDKLQKTQPSEHWSFIPTDTTDCPRRLTTL